MIGVQELWGWQVALYLFLGGLGGGVFVVSSAISLTGRKRYRRLCRAGYWVALLCVVGGLLCLLFEIIYPYRALCLTQSFVNKTSWMARGAWIAVVAVGAFLGQGLLSLPFVRRYAKNTTIYSVVCLVVKGAGCVVGLGLCLYTGVLLMHATGVPFWDTPLLPVLFLVSAFSAAMNALVLIAVVLGANRRVSRRRSRRLVGAMTLLSALEGVVLVVYLKTMATVEGGMVDPAATAAAYSAQLLLRETYALPFWGCVVVGGLIIPLGLSLASIRFSKRGAWICLSLGAALSILGDCILRFLVLYAATRPDYLADSLLQLL